MRRCRSSPIRPLLSTILLSQKGLSKVKRYTQINSNLESQIRIAKYLLSNPNGVVFTEDRVKTSYNYGTKSRGFSQAHTIFPDGIPSDFNSLNHEQQKFLMCYGAENVLHFLGKIDTLHRSISPQKDKKIRNAIDGALYGGHPNPRSEPFRSLICDQREQALLAEIRKLVSSNQDGRKKIVIIYGAGHNFEKYFNSEKFQSVNTDVDYSSRLEVLNKRLLIDSNDLDARLERASIADQEHRYAEALADYQYLDDFYEDRIDLYDDSNGAYEKVRKMEQEIEHIRHVWGQNK